MGSVIFQNVSQVVAPSIEQDSYIEGDNLNVEVTSEEETEDDIDDIAASMNTGMQDIDDISLEDDWDDDLTVG